MAIAAIAAPPMASTNFQSANISFNEKLRILKWVESRAAGWKSRARNTAEMLTSSANAPLLRILPKPRRLRESTVVAGAPAIAEPPHHHSPPPTPLSPPPPPHPPPLTHA